MNDITINALDEIDFSIMSRLQNDGRKSFTEIAKELDVAVNTVRNRVAKMVDNGVLRFIARVPPEKVGFQAYANIMIRAERSQDVDFIAHEVLKYPEVSFVSLVVGDYDLLLDAMCYNNEHLTDLLTKRIQKIPGVEKTQTIIMVKVLNWDNPDLVALKEYWANNTETP